MKVIKHGNKYRVQKQINGKRVNLSFDHKPSPQEIYAALADNDFSAQKGSFLSCAQSYIQSKSNVLSPRTIRGYYSILNSSISETFKNKSVSQIEQQDIQLVINDYASNHSPKSVRNLHGFISAVLKQFRPNLNIYTTLPQKVVNERYTPSEEDIKRILDASKDDHPNHICFQLGIMSLRRSEILALTPDDIEGNILTINKALVLNEKNEWVIKQTKTTAGTRKIYIPDNLVAEIMDQGYVYNRHPNKMRLALQKYQDKLGIPHFRFHDLRHFFASYAHEKGIMSEQTIMETGGWHSVETLRKVYRHSMNTQESQKALFDCIIGQ